MTMTEVASMYGLNVMTTDPWTEVSALASSVPGWIGLASDCWVYFSEMDPTFPLTTTFCTLTGFLVLVNVKVMVGLTGLLAGTFHPDAFGRTSVTELVGTVGTPTIMLSSMINELSRPSISLHTVGVW